MRVEQERFVERTDRNRTRRLDGADGPLPYGEFLERENKASARPTVDTAELRSGDRDRFGAPKIGDVFKGHATAGVCETTSYGRDGRAVTQPATSGFTARLIDVIA